MSSSGSASGTGLWLSPGKRDCCRLVSVGPIGRANSWRVPAAVRGFRGGLADEDVAPFLCADIFLLSPRALVLQALLIFLMRSASSGESSFFFSLAGRSMAFCSPSSSSEPGTNEGTTLKGWEIDRCECSPASSIAALWILMYEYSTKHPSWDDLKQVTTSSRHIV